MSGPLGRLDQAALWGQAFEIAVKRGVLACLCARNLITPDHPHLTPWRETRVAKLQAALRNELGLLDDRLIAQVNGATLHLLTLGYGLGWTGMREYLKQVKGALTVKGLWCPLTLPTTQRDRATEAAKAALQLLAAFGLERSRVSLTQKGQPAWSDFTLWLGSERPRLDHLLVLEFSYYAPRAIPDFSREADHLEEVSRHARLLDSRGVFSRVCAEVKGERFAFSSLLGSHLGAFASRDKPLYKLCQGASYVETTMDLLRMAGRLEGPCNGRALAITPHGFESLAARYDDRADDPRRELMQQLAHAYHQAIKVSDDEAEAHLVEEMRRVFKKLIQALPTDFRQQAKELERTPEPDQEISFTFQETVDGFMRPTQQLTIAEALDQVGCDSTPHPNPPPQGGKECCNPPPQGERELLLTWLGQPTREALEAELPRFARDGKITLRDLHGAAVVVALRATRRNRLNVLALEGNPGIGKTTAVRRYLTDVAEDGYLFLYVSPRVVINKDVTDQFARREDDNKSASGILTLTTHATLIRNAAVGYQAMVQQGSPSKIVDRAVIVEGVEGLALPENTSLWFISPAEEAVLENVHGRSALSKELLSERRELVRERQQPGVLRTLAKGARQLIHANPGLNRVVLTAALQGYRETGNGGTTIQALSHLFENQDAKRPAGLAERRRFAGRFPNILVMLDEVAGDSAGALFVDEIARWLDRQFLEPLEREEGGSPFRVTLIIADASLGNEQVLESYLAAGERAPEKVLVSHSGGHYPFRMAATRFSLGGTRAEVLHVMTNSFPATALAIEYRLKLHRLHPELHHDGTPKSLRARLRNQSDSLFLRSAREEILRAVRADAPQIIFFAQHKDFLSRLRLALLEADPQTAGTPPVLAEHDVAILDGSVHASDRKVLIQEPRRDRIRVFLMTSSGARGISFPKATHIIAAIPRFNLESSLMEVAQLIYRGRGGYQDPVTGARISGDDQPRRLVMLVDDFLPDEDWRDDPRLWLRRSSDLLTLVLLLRGTLHTRIRGDAGLPGKDLAIVPVGLVGSSELLATMSQALEAFLKESMVIMLRATHSDEKGLIANARHSVLRLFATYRLEAADETGDYRSFTARRELDEFIHAITDSASSLFSALGATESLPETRYCTGPYWLEDWSALHKTETLVFDRYSSAIEEANRELKGQLAAIWSQPKLPTRLHNAARDLHRILDREPGESRRELETLKLLASKATWLALPLDYPRFWRNRSEKDDQPDRLEEETAWRDALARVLQTTGNIIPVIPHYATFPFAAAIGAMDPMRLYSVFDDRYFMASTELNVLNTLLLADQAEEQSRS